MKTTRPQRTVISLAIATALSTMLPTVALGQTVISVNTSATQFWSDNDFTVNSGVTLNSDPGDAAIYASSASTQGDFLNNGTINGAFAGLFSSAAINQLQNNGVIRGETYYGVVSTQGAEINAFINNGSISGAPAGMLNEGVINSFTNQQTGNIYGLVNAGTGTIADLANQGFISQLDNGGTIVGLSNTGSISNLVNASSGTIFDLVNEGTITKVENSGILVGSAGFGSGLINTGTITLVENKTGGYIQSLGNSGSIATLNNAGTLNGIFGLLNMRNMNPDGANIGTLNNSGTITGGYYGGISNSAGTIDILRNSGTITSTDTYGIFNGASSEITALTNTATGAISGFTTGIFNAGLITSITNNGDIYGPTAISNGGQITSMGPSPTTMHYAGTIATLSNTGTIWGIGSAGDGVALSNATNSQIGLLSNTGSISGDAVAIINRGTIGKLDNGTLGIVSGAMAIWNLGTITELSNSGKIFVSGPAVAGSSYSISNQGLITSLVNNQGGVISDADYAIDNAGSGTITTLLNNGLIKGRYTGFKNDGGNIGSIVNNGAIEGDNFGIENRENIGVLNNNGRIFGGIAGILIYNVGVFTELNNSGTIAGDTFAGVVNYSKITSLNNKPGGLIQNGVYNDSFGTIDTLNNQGTIAGSSSSTTAYALSNDGHIGTLNNSGLLTSPVDAIYLGGTGTIGNFINSGKVAGNIRNYSVGYDLVIQGGSGTTFGVLTGSSGGTGAADIGLIDNPYGQLVFGAGNQLLNDHINVGTAGNSVVNLDGVLQVNNYINITGDYAQRAAATLNIGVARNAIANGDSADLGYGRLIVSGSAVIDAGSSVMLKKTGAYRFANGQRYVVVQANGSGTNYNETALNYGATGYSGTITGSTIASGGNLSLLLTLDGAADNQATNSNGQNTLNALFNYSGTDAGLMNLFNAAAASGSSDEGNRAGAQLNPAAGKAGVAGASTAVSQQVTGIAFDRLSNTSAVAGLAGNGLSAGDGMRDQAVWGQAFGGKASADARDGVSGYHASYAGLLLGADTAWNDQWRVGGLFNYASTSVSNDDYNAGSYSRINSYGLSAYAGYTGEPWYLNISVGAMRSDVKAHRVVDLTGFHGVADSNYNGMQYIAAAQLGYPIKVDQVLPGAVLTPLAGLVYSSLRQDGYTETGGNGAALQVGSSSTHSVKSDLGFKLERAYKTTYGLLKPSVQLLWRHEYSDTRLQSIANFAADTTGVTSFTSQGAKPVKDTGVLSLGATLLRSDKLTLSANYTLEQGGGYSSQTGSLLARWRF
ncbi:autotransporter domain-containing protein [Herminiimonas glaciei]|uniref:Autotransporter domain-containing protein n=1 Tax=Herminiimonas glaciei TaxID=523788 RepID=A0ABW2IGC3_9BURK